MSSWYSTASDAPVYMVTYVIASYRIAGGVTGSSARRVDLDRFARAPSTGGARRRETRRGVARVRRSPA
jgi:hypothetical protein